MKKILLSICSWLLVCGSLGTAEAGSLKILDFHIFGGKTININTFDGDPISRWKHDLELLDQEINSGFKYALQSSYEGEDLASRMETLQLSESFNTLLAKGWTPTWSKSATTIPTKAVPEPATLFLFGAGVAGLIGAGKKRRREE